MKEPNDDESGLRNVFCVGRFLFCLNSDDTVCTKKKKEEEDRSKKETTRMMLSVFFSLFIVWLHGENNFRLYRRLSSSSSSFFVPATYTHGIWVCYALSWKFLGMHDCDQLLL